MTISLIVATILIIMAGVGGYIIGYAVGKIQERKSSR